MAKNNINFITSEIGDGKKKCEYYICIISYFYYICTFGSSGFEIVCEGVETLF